MLCCALSGAANRTEEINMTHKEMVNTVENAIAALCRVLDELKQAKK
jgi:hypothetical protein